MELGRPGAGDARGMRDVLRVNTTERKNLGYIIILLPPGDLLKWILPSQELGIIPCLPRGKVWRHLTANLPPGKEVHCERAHAALEGISVA